MIQAEATRFAALYESYFGQVYAYCRRRSSEDAVDDLVADVYLTVWRKIGNAPEGEDALRWLYRIAYLVLANHWRSAGRRRKLAQKLESIGVGSAPLLSDQVVVREEVRQVLEAARRLAPKDQELLRLASWEHLSMEDIAVILDVTANTVKQRLHRARTRLVREHQRSSRRNVNSPAALEGGEA